MASSLANLNCPQKPGPRAWNIAPLHAQVNFDDVKVPACGTIPCLYVSVSVCVWGRGGARPRCPWQFVTMRVAEINVFVSFLIFSFLSPVLAIMISSMARSPGDLKTLSDEILYDILRTVFLTFISILVNVYSNTIIVD
jgi:hypothetical protein